MTASLTDRHQQILELVAQGLTDVEVGERLYISSDTVKSHLGAMLKRLGARNRTHAVTLGHQLGLLPLTAATDDRREAEMDRLQGHLTLTLIENAALRRQIRLQQEAAA